MNMVFHFGLYMNETTWRIIAHQNNVSLSPNGQLTYCSVVLASLLSLPEGHNVFPFDQQQRRYTFQISVVAQNSLIEV